jgi:hypothetical protein
MKKLDKNELSQLADSFLNLAQVVGAFRIEYYRQLSPNMQRRIRTQHKTLIDYADTFYAASSSVIVTDANHVIEKIQRITLGLKEDVKKVKKVQFIINTIGAATRMGAAIMSNQPIAITASLEEFISSFEKLKTSIKN